MPDSNNTIDSRVTVAVPAPGTGAELAVTSEAGGNLKFDFDPAQATATRPDGTNELVFELDGDYGKNTYPQQIEINLTCGLEQNMVDALNSGNADAQAAILQQLLAS